MNLIDLSGKRFGRLTVVSRAGTIRYSRSPQPTWACLCDCGKETTILGCRLRSGHTKSCGCYKSIVRRKEYGASSKRKAYQNYRKNAIIRQIIFNLTQQEFITLAGQPCFYCGSEASNVISGNRSYGPFVYNGIDRIDSTKEYSVPNCVPCCKICNRAKSNMSYEEFMNWINRLVERRSIAYEGYFNEE
jgi:hypothetical protein